MEDTEAQGLLFWLLERDIDMDIDIVLDLDIDVEADVKVDVDIRRYFGFLKGVSKSVQSPLSGIETVKQL